MKQRVITYSLKKMMPDKPWLGYTFVEPKVVQEKDLPPGMFDWIVVQVKKLGFAYTIRHHQDEIIESNEQE
jgi:hypothetical protein